MPSVFVVQSLFYQYPLAPLVKPRYVAPVFGALLRRARQARDLDQAALGAAVGVSHATISQWERGHRLPDVEQLRALCAVLHVSADVLLERVAFQLGPVEVEDPATRFKRA